MNRRVQQIAPATAKKLVAAAGEGLSGGWILVGGALLLYLGASARATQDIDLVPMGEMSNREQLKLFALAEGLGLPPEAVNSAAGYFLHKLKDFKSSLELLHEGSKARIFRPNATLYLRLKLSRLSESDLSDCLAMLKWAAAQGEVIEPKFIKEGLPKALREASADPERLARLEVLARSVRSG